MGRIAVVTMVGAAFGTVAGMLFSSVYYDGVIRPQDASTGTLSGLVSITAACAVITVWQAAAAAFIGGLLSCVVALLLEAACVDDPVSAVAVHGVGGLWGLVVVGLFNMGADYGPQAGPKELHGLFPGGSWEQLGVQVYGGLAMVAWTTACTFVLVKALDHTMGCRVPLKIELEGLDKEEHGICANPTQFLHERRQRARRRWARQLQRLGLRQLASAAGGERHADGSPDGSVHSADVFAPPTADNLASRPTPDPSTTSGETYRATTPPPAAAQAPADADPPDSSAAAANAPAEATPASAGEEDGQK